MAEEFCRKMHCFNCTLKNVKKRRTMEQMQIKRIKQNGQIDHSPLKALMGLAGREIMGLRNAKSKSNAIPLFSIYLSDV